ncbi:MAG TPA: CHAP domain-containing protein, partial [Chloroflexota bacterium]|nr:CHAP domain-containing protein [Chloroflexota bacterium]
SWCSENGGYRLGASFHDVYACGPPTGPADPFDTAGFQCVELSERFMWVVNGQVVPFVPDGRDFVSLGHSELNIPVGSPAPGSLPAPGDIVSLWGGSKANQYGHTAVVTSVDVDGNGDGSIQLMEENGNSNGWDEIEVSNWRETYGDPNYGGGIFYYTHVDWLELAQSSSGQAGLEYAVTDLGPEASASGLNDSATVGGVTRQSIERISSSPKPFLYHQGRLDVVANPRRDATGAVVNGINNSGAMPVSVAYGRYNHAAFTLTSIGGTAWHQLPKPEGFEVPMTAGINSRGDVAGWFAQTKHSRTSVGAVWVHQGRGYWTRLLYANRYFANPKVYHSDTQGDAIGTETLRGQIYAVYWAPWGKAYRLPPLAGGDELGSPNALQVQIKGKNRLLTVTGRSVSDNGMMQACEWQISISGHSFHISVPTAVGPAPSTGSSAGMGLNSSDWIVGDVKQSDGAKRAFLWRPGYGEVDLDSLLDPSSGWRVVSVRGINTADQIVAEGYQAGSGSSKHLHSLLLTPTTKGG